MIALRSFYRDKLDYGWVNFKVGKINCRYAILLGKEIGDILVGHEAEFDQSRT